MARHEPKFKVAGIERLHTARRMIESGEYKRAAMLINDFCWSNATLQGEGGDYWSDLKFAAYKLVSGINADAAQKLVGSLWRKVLPRLLPI